MTTAAVFEGDHGLNLEVLSEVPTTYTILAHIFDSVARSFGFRLSHETLVRITRTAVFVRMVDRLIDDAVAGKAGTPDEAQAVLGRLLDGDRGNLPDWVDPRFSEVSDLVASSLADLDPAKFKVLGLEVLKLSLQKSQAADIEAYLTAANAEGRRCADLFLECLDASERRGARFDEFARWMREGIALATLHDTWIDFGEDSASGLTLVEATRDHRRRARQATIRLSVSCVRSHPSAVWHLILGAVLYKLRLRRI